MRDHDDVARLIEKYTGAKFGWDQLYGEKALLSGRLAHLAYGIQSDETSLLRAAMQLEYLAKKINSNVTAGPDDKIMQLNPIGELQGNEASRVNGLIASRAARIEALRMLVGLAKELA